MNCPVSFDRKTPAPNEPFVPVMVAYREDSVFARYLYGDLFPAVAIPIFLHIDNATMLAEIISGGKLSPQEVQRVAKEFDTAHAYLAVIPYQGGEKEFLKAFGGLSLEMPNMARRYEFNPRENHYMAFFPMEDVEGRKRAIQLTSTQSGRNGVSPVVMESIREAMLAMIDHPTVEVKVRTSFPGSKQFDA